MPTETYYDFATITNYPELRGYLQDKLRELGDVTVEVHEKLGPPYYSVTVKFSEAPVIQNWWDGRLGGGLHIADAGGCFSRGLAVCRKIPEKSNGFVGEFVFDLSLDSRDTPYHQHKEWVLRGRIDEFVSRAKVGFCYHFGGALLKQEITERAR